MSFVQDYINKVLMKANFKKSNISFKDIAFFAPEVNQLTVKNVIIKSNNNIKPANVNCKPPQGYRFLTIEFPNPTYLGCFVISQSLSNSIISGRDTRVTITFKSDLNNLNTITQIQ